MDDNVHSSSSMPLIVSSNKCVIQICICLSIPCERRQLIGSLSSACVCCDCLLFGLLFGFCLLVFCATHSTPFRRPPPPTATMSIVQNDREWNRTRTSHTHTHRQTDNSCTWAHVATADSREGERERERVRSVDGAAAATRRRLPLRPPDSTSDRISAACTHHRSVSARALSPPAQTVSSLASTTAACACARACARACSTAAMSASSATESS